MKIESVYHASSSMTVGSGCEVRYRIICELTDDANLGLALFAFDLEFDGGSLPLADEPIELPMNNFVRPAGITNSAGFGGTPADGKLLQVGGAQNTIMNGQLLCNDDADCPDGSTCEGDLCTPVADFPVGTVITGLACAGSPQVLVTGALTAPTVEGSYTLHLTNLFARAIRAGETGIPFWATDSCNPGEVVDLDILVENGGTCFADCQPNGIADPLEIETGLVGDCNTNGIPDECDIESGLSEDLNANGVPDECERPPAPEPGGPACSVAADCAGAYEGADCVAGTCYVPKNRYLSIDPTTDDTEVAYQIELIVAADYPTAIGRTWWLDVPVCYDYPNGNPVVPPPSTCEGDNHFGWVSKLTTTPVSRVWAESPLHITGCGIAPAVTYAISSSADAGASFSDPLTIGTARDPEGPAQQWGDVTGGPVEGTPGLWLPPEGTMNFADIGNAIRTFENRWQDTGSPPRMWVDMEVNQVVNMGDIQFIVSAFEGMAYADIQLDLIGINPAQCP